MAQWKRAGLITQRSVDRNYLLLIFLRISIGEDIEKVSSQVNERESGKNYTTLSQKNHNTRSRVLKISNASRMAQWKRAGPITEVGRSKLPPANFLSRISVREEIKTLTSQINKRESGENYTSLPTNHNTRSRVPITL